MREMEVKMYLGQNEAAARKIVRQRALRDCSKEVRGRVRVYVIW